MTQHWSLSRIRPYSLQLTLTQTMSEWAGLALGLQWLRWSSHGWGGGRQCPTQVNHGGSWGWSQGSRVDHWSCGVDRAGCQEMQGFCLHSCVLLPVLFLSKGWGGVRLSVCWSKNMNCSLESSLSSSVRCWEVEVVNMKHTHACNICVYRRYYWFFSHLKGTFATALYQSSDGNEVLGWRWLVYYKTTTVCFSFIGLSTDFEHLKLTSALSICCCSLTVWRDVCRLRWFRWSRSIQR